MRASSMLAAATAMTGLATAAPHAANLKDKRSFEVDHGVNYTVFEHAATGASMKFVTNSGICETTPGVNQYSGYLSVGDNENMFFWFFEARNSPTTAPLATWFNGGPGCSSMIGLFQENGPCHFVNGESTPSLNPYSWNEYANMLYIDQPIGVGFSYGSNPASSTATAAPLVWALLQAFYAQFPQYESREFGLFTESYGGHYGPGFASYLETQNAAVDAGTVKGEKVDLIALGINDGWFDPVLQYKAYIDYSANNSFSGQISASDASSYMDSYSNDCVPALQACQSSGSDQDCSNAQQTCYSEIEGALTQVGDFDVYDVRAPSNDPNPPETYSSYLSSSSVMKAIGAQSSYTECSNPVGNQFSETGDNSRTYLPALSSVVQSGVRTVVWAGDVDWICNWYGNQAVANAVDYPGHSTFESTDLAPYSVNGKQGGTFKTVDNFSFLRVFQAGHEIPFYAPEVALQVFTQTMKKQPLAST
ncbi:MAG: hypothetical protein M1838_000962 [Thelocarpon superellum]|nr:MAG: hypothetical protein M1838_000962 [Thelocarpon superellum]